jgi:hypothetical protein
MAVRLSSNAADSLQLHAGGDALPDPVFAGGIQYQVHVAEPPVHIQDGFGGGDIDQQQVVTDTALLRINTQHIEYGGPAPVHNVQPVTCSDIERARRCRAKHQRICLCQPISDEARASRYIGKQTAEWRLGKQVKPHQMVTSRAAFDPDPATHHWCHGRCTGLAFQADIHLIG